MQFATPILLLLAPALGGIQDSPTQTLAKELVESVEQRRYLTSLSVMIHDIREIPGTYKPEGDEPHDIGPLIKQELVVALSSYIKLVATDLTLSGQLPKADEEIDLRELADSHGANAVIIGTWIRTGAQEYFIHLTMIEVVSNLVIGAASQSINLDWSQYLQVPGGGVGGVDAQVVSQGGGGGDVYYVDGDYIDGGYYSGSDYSYYGGGSGFSISLGYGYRGFFGGIGYGYGYGYGYWCGYGRYYRPYGYSWYCPWYYPYYGYGWYWPWSCFGYGGYYPYYHDYGYASYVPPVPGSAPPASPRPGINRPGAAAGQRSRTLSSDRITSLGDRKGGSLRPVGGNGSGSGNGGLRSGGSLSQPRRSADLSNGLVKSQPKTLSETTRRTGHFAPMTRPASKDGDGKLRPSGLIDRSETPTTDDRGNGPGNRPTNPGASGNSNPGASGNSGGSQGSPGLAGGRSRPKASPAPRTGQMRPTRTPAPKLKTIDNRSVASSSSLNRIKAAPSTHSLGLTSRRAAPPTRQSSPNITPSTPPPVRTDTPFGRPSSSGTRSTPTLRTNTSRPTVAPRSNSSSGVGAPPIRSSSPGLTRPSGSSSRPTIQRPTSRPSSRISRPSSSGSGSISRPSSRPSTNSSSRPSIRPSSQPRSQPSARPSTRPSSRPTARPSSRPTSRPTARPSSRPSSRPTARPSSRPSSRPTARPSSRPSSRPTARPSSRGSSRPSARPSGRPR